MTADPIEVFYRKLSLRSIQKLAKVARRGDTFKVTVPHTVGFGGSRVFTVRGFCDEREAVRVVHRSLRNKVAS